MLATKAGAVRRRSIAITVIGAALLLAACGTGGDTPGTGGKSKFAKLVWWHNANAEPAKSFYQKVVLDFQATHPNVIIDQVITDSESMKAKIQVAMQSPNPPDVIHQWGGGWMADQVKAGKLMDLTASTQDAVPKLAGNSGWQIDGKVYGLNFALGVNGFWYRKDLFAQVGITKTPTTLDQLMQDVHKLRNAGIEPIALGGKDKWPTAFWYGAFVVRECSKTALDSTVKSLRFDDPCWAKSAEDFQQVVDAKPFAKGYLATTAQNGAGSSAGQIATGKAAMELMGQWDASVITGLTPGQKPLPSTVLGWFPFPSVPGAAGAQDAQLGGGDGYSCSYKAPPVCVDFIKYFTSADVQRRYAKQVGRIPANKDASDGLTDPNLKAIVVARDGASFIQPALDVALGTDVGNALNDAVSLQLAGGSTPAQFITAIQDSATQHK